MFEAVAGQRRVKEHFARLLRDGAVAHAYLFTGREGLGKTAFARELGGVLVTSCGGCGACAECDRARRGLHPALHVVEREGDVIRVDQVDPILADLSLKPFASGRRVWLIPEAEHLNKESANRLLKAIEEPPRLVHFLLVTDRLERVLPTIVSRCQIVEFRPLSDVEVVTFLRDERQLDELRATALARLASGSIERAERLAADARGPGRRDEYLTRSAMIVGGRPTEASDARQAFLAALAGHQAEIKAALRTELERRLGELAQQFEDKRDLEWHEASAKERARREERRLTRLAAQDALDVLISWVRDLWVVSCAAADVLWNCDREVDVRRSAVGSPDYYARLLTVALRTRKDLSLNVDQKLALQALFARFEEVAQSA